MTKKSNFAEELPRPYLICSRAEAEEKIDKQLEKGKFLEERSMNSQSELELAESDLQKWHDYNKELFGIIFSNEKFVQEYENKSYASFYTMGETSFFEDVKEYLEGVHRKIDALTSIKERLELIPENTKVNHTFHDNSLSHKATGNYTLNISGGTVMLGDGNKVNNITVGDIITELTHEISKLPDSPEKGEAFKGLRALSKNETFANVTSVLLGTFLSGLVK